MLLRGHAQKVLHGYEDKAPNSSKGVILDARPHVGTIYRLRAPGKFVIGSSCKYHNLRSPIVHALSV